MAYATPADMLARYGHTQLAQLCDRGQAQASVVDSDVLATALSDASALIDGYLVGRYALPLIPAPAVLMPICCQLARYNLMTHAPDDKALKDYEGAVKFLTLIAEGKTTLLPPAAAPSLAGAGAVVFSPGAKVFGRDRGGADA